MKFIWRLMHIYTFLKVRGFKEFWGSSTGRNRKFRHVSLYVRPKGKNSFPLEEYSYNFKFYIIIIIIIIIKNLLNNFKLGLN